MPAILEVVGLHRSFGALRAVDGCSFGVEEGSAMGVVGPNGSGKTTLFNCITGVLPADGGDILLRGRSVQGWPAHRIARAGLGRTFQTSRVFPKLTVRQNLEAAAVLAGRRGGETGREFLELFDLWGYRDHPAGALSYGQKKLVELAAVMATKPEVVLLDEPAAGVNPAFLKFLQDYIRRARAAGQTFLIVEHNIPFVFDLCDRVMVMNYGAKIAEGPPEVIRRDDRVLEAYLGETGDGA